MTREEAIRKAAALLRLAAKPGTVGEAAAAAAGAQRILDRFELTREVVEMGGAEKPEADEEIEDFTDKAEGYIDSMRWREYWRIYLVGGIARPRGCFIYTGRRGLGKSIEIVGKPGQVESVRYMYLWLSKALLEMSQVHGRGMTAAWKREFLEGGAHEIGRRLMEMQKATQREVLAENEKNPHALAIVQNAIVRLDADHAIARSSAYRKHRLSGVSRSGGAQYSPTARQAGAEAARGINLSQAAGAIDGRAPKQIGGRS